VALSLALILEEGLEVAVLERILDSVAAAAAGAGAVIATGDTKVIERRSQGDSSLMINTTGVGRMRDDVDLDGSRIKPGDAVLINGPVAEHGLAVMSAREGLAFETEIKSDAACLHGLIAALLDSGADVKFMRDPTRGGAAGVLVDLAELTGLSVEIEEAAVPVTPASRGAADMLGLDPLTVANEGKVIAVVPGDRAETALGAMASNPLGRGAAVLGRMTDRTPALVELVTRAGGRRMVSRPYGEELPRIC
jgi:hydrogenase expression/formation protein HypE